MKDQQIYYSCGQKYQWRLRLFLWCYYHSFLWGDKNWLVNNWYFGHWNLWLWNHVHTVWPRLQHAQSQPFYIYIYVYYFDNAPQQESQSVLHPFVSGRQHLCTWSSKSAHAHPYTADQLMGTAVGPTCQPKTYEFIGWTREDCQQCWLSLEFERKIAAIPCCCFCLRT